MTARTLTSAPDTILYNARIFTVDSSNPWAEAVSIRDGIIVAIGDSGDILQLAGADTRVIDLGNRLVLPGFCDSHIHFYTWSLGQTDLDFAGANSKSEMLDMIHERSAISADDAWIVGRGWNESWWGDTVYPTAADMDSVTKPGQPALFWRTDLHTAVVNSRGMQLAGVDASTANPTGGLIERYADGTPTGVLKELATSLVSDLIPAPSEEQAAIAVSSGIQALHEMGITAIHDQRIKDNDDGIAALNVYQALDNGGGLQLRINCNFAAHQMPHVAGLGLSYGFGNERLRLGHVKVFADGSMGSQTCLMLEPFEKESASEPDNTGVRLTEPAEITALFYQAASLGFPISIHAIGDRANREVLDIFEELQENSSSLPVPHRIEHVQIMEDEDVARLGKMGITASVQPVHIIDDIEIGSRILGERCSLLYRFASLLDTGAVLAFGSDAPVADPNPFLGIHSALYRQKPNNMTSGLWYEDESISLEQALYAYTMGPAIAAGWQDDIGSIEVGKRADIIALDRDLFEIVDSQIFGDEVSGTKVDMTLFDGVITYSNL